MIHIIAIMILYSLFPCVSVMAQENSDLKVDEFIFCSAIEDRQPAGVDSVFSEDIEKVYCYTKITNIEEPTTISHVWYYRDEVKAKVELNIKNRVWRTWSSKDMWSGWIGEWRVDIVTEFGDVIASKNFYIKIND